MATAAAGRPGGGQGTPLPPKAGREEAAALIWDWRGARSEDSTATAVRPRLRGTLQSLAGATAGTLIFTLLSRTAGSIVIGIAAVILLSALLSPGGLYAGIERLFAALGRRLGTGLSWIILPMIFYLVFLPFGALFRRGRRDPMKRFYDPDVSSYWSSRDEGRSGSAARNRQY